MHRADQHLKNRPREVVLPDERNRASIPRIVTRPNHPVQPRWHVGRSPVSYLGRVIGPIVWIGRVGVGVGKNVVDGLVFRSRSGRGAQNVGRGGRNSIVVRSRSIELSYGPGTAITASQRRIPRESPGPDLVDPPLLPSPLAAPLHSQ